jgi:RNase H-like domain found in reverse transcriptase
MPRLTTVTEVQSLLGLANYYRRFIQDFARISAPLLELTKKGVPFEWGGGDQENSFQNLKDAAEYAPVLLLADPAKPYIVTCDASDVGIGAVLEQESENGPHPVAFASEPKEIIMCTSASFLLSFTRSRSGARTCTAVGSSSKPTTTKCAIWTLGPIFQRDRCDGWRRCKSTTTR